MHKICLALIAVLVFPGCANYVRLLRSTNNQTRTITDLYFQQVLDNVAMFNASPYSMPFFAVAAQGQSQLRTAGTINGQPTWVPGGIKETFLNLGASREVTQFWTMQPVSDTSKLMRMRCAYQIVVGLHAAGPDDPCFDCCEYLRAWPWAATRPSPPPVPTSRESEEVGVPEPEDSGRPRSPERGFTRSSGDNGPDPYIDPSMTKPRDGVAAPTRRVRREMQVSAECIDQCNIPGPGWYHCARGIGCVPKDAPYSGHYNDTYVWVDRNGMDALTRLTFAILDFATYRVTGDAQGMAAGQGAKVRDMPYGTLILPPYPSP